MSPNFWTSEDICFPIFCNYCLKTFQCLFFSQFVSLCFLYTLYGIISIYILHRISLGGCRCFHIFNLIVKFTFFLIEMFSSFFLLFCDEIYFLTKLVIFTSILINFLVRDITWLGRIIPVLRLLWIGKPLYTVRVYYVYQKLLVSLSLSKVIRIFQNL